jgi:hypothetical protein
LPWQWQPRPLFYGGGAHSAFRAYRAHHPAAAIYDQTYNGRTVWMTAKQVAIWSTVRAYWRQGKLLSLESIATRVGCSKSHVSRFLHRLHLWRFIKLIVLRGPGGGVYVLTQKRGFKSVKIQRQQNRMHATHLLKMRAFMDAFSAEWTKLQRASKVVIRSQLLLTDWLDIWGGRPLI